MTERSLARADLYDWIMLRRISDSGAARAITMLIETVRAQTATLITTPAAQR